jgi:hypothetical protein
MSTQLKQTNAALEKLAHSCKKNHTRQSLVLPKTYKENTSHNHSFGIESPLDNRYAKYRSPVPSPADDDSNSLSLIHTSQPSDSFTLYFASQEQAESQNVKELKAENEQLRKQLKQKDHELQKLKDLLKTIGFKSRDQARRLDRVNKPDPFEFSADLVHNATTTLDSKLKKRNRRIDELHERLKALYEQHRVIERNCDRD